jgi:hypothetical protein
MRNDILVSFEGNVLNPSIPVDEALDFVKRWLEEQQLKLDVLTQYLELT